MKSMVEIKLEEELDLGDTFGIGIFVENIEIGSICGLFTGEGFLIELIDIEEEYRGKGYGTESMELFKKMAKDVYCARYIRGECPGNRINFYEKVGAIFECRDEYDETFINHVFYIDL